MFCLLMSSQIWPSGVWWPSAIRGIRRQSFWALKESESNRVRARGSQLRFGARGSVWGQEEPCNTLDIFEPRLCFGKPVTQCFLGVLYIRQHAPQFEVSSRTEIGIVEKKIMCKFCFSVSSRKNSVPAEIALRCSHHLKEVSTREEASVYQNAEMNSDWIGLLFPVQLWLG